MKSSTDTENERIRFKFTAIESEFNLFHIQSPDLGEYIFMKENSSCKYSTSVKEQDTAKWRVILVQDTEEKEGSPSCFMLCTKKMAREIFFLWKRRFSKAQEG